MIKHIDKIFFIESSNLNLIQSILEPEELRNKLYSIPNLNIKNGVLYTSKANEIGDLYSQYSGVIKSRQTLKELIVLYKYLLNHLSKIGAIYLESEIPYKEFPIENYTKPSIL